MASKILAFVVILGLSCSSKIADAQSPAWNGPIWQQKMTNFFNAKDLNKNHLHDNNDTETLSYGYKPFGQFWVTSLYATETAMWLKLYINQPLAAPGAPLNAATLITCLGALGELNAALNVIVLVPPFFLNIDTNKDGVIQNSEYEFMFSPLNGLSPGEIQAAFTALDTNKGGTLSLTEFGIGWLDFFTTSEEGDNYNILMGPVSG